jgi:hypothetical protein
VRLEYLLSGEVTTREKVNIALFLRLDSIFIKYKERKQFLEKAV